MKQRQFDADGQRIEKRRLFRGAKDQNASNTKEESYLLTIQFDLKCKEITLARDLKAAKYKIQKASTWHATLFRCKFWSMFLVFHLA